MDFDDLGEDSIFNNNNEDIFGGESDIEDALYTQSGHYQPEMPSEPNDPIPCFLKGTKILTTIGEVRIEDLKTTDKLINCLGNKCNIVKIASFKRGKNKSTHPYVISKDTKINEFVCKEDLYLSKDHAVLINNKYFIEAKNLPFAKQITNLQCEQYEYYHIITDNYLTDTIISNGIPTETFGNYVHTNEVRIIQHMKKQTHNYNASPIEKQNYKFTLSGRASHTTQRVNKFHL